MLEYEWMSGYRVIAGNMRSGGGGGVSLNSPKRCLWEGSFDTKKKDFCLLFLFPIHISILVIHGLLKQWWILLWLNRYYSYWTESGVSRCLLFWFGAEVACRQAGRRAGVGVTGVLKLFREPPRWPWDLSTLSSLREQALPHSIVCYLCCANSQSGHPGVVWWPSPVFWSWNILLSTIIENTLLFI